MFTQVRVCPAPPCVPPSTLVPALRHVPGGIPLASKSSARLAALTVAAVCSASTIVLTSPAQADSVRVHDIQGSTRLSPYAGRQVTDVAGIVTGVRGYGSSRGFWIQDPRPDADPATSEGVFVFTGSTPKGVAVGDAVTVSGTVSEYVPGGTSSGNQSLTEITRPTFTVVSSGNEIPAATTISARSVPRAYAPRGTRRRTARSTACRCTPRSTPWTSTSPWRA
ncbi:hypothetical protein GCM10010308_43010 [Streptomyces vinaceusdrappus]|nr:hypothetical protein GCM10010308_43010 [Streptomyces vinaceusdrappus]